MKLASVFKMNYFQDLLFSDRNELYVSMKNVLSKEEVFEGEISYGKIQNFTHFIQINTPIYNRFQANYIDLVQLHCKADYSKKINNLLSFIMTLDYYRWSQEVYYKPNFIYYVSLHFTLRVKIKVYSNIDIFAMPSHSRFFGLEYEGLGLVYLEAASYGKPVITGSSGGSPETIIPGKTGFVADTKNHLYDAIKYFLDNPTSINKFGSEGKIFISDNFSWQNVISKYRSTLGAHENSNKIEEE